MKIVIGTINPLFADKVIGGSTKHLRRIAEHLGDLGHDVTVLCTARPGEDSDLRWGDCVIVKRCFDFKQPFPMPYDVPAYRFADVIQQVADHLVDADRLYLHDGEILFPALCHAVPSVASLRDCVYPETMLGSFLFQADALIAITDYCRDSVLATAGRFLVDLDARARVIPNGFDWEFFRPTPPSAELLTILNVDPARHTIVLHPHRPELTKGLRQTIEVVDRLVNQYDFNDLKVLAPEWFDAPETPEMAHYLDDMAAEIRRRGLADVFAFHGWLPHRLMPEYYSLGGVTLVLGSFVEAFGNSAYESLGCGTPAIVSRVSSNRSILPDDLIDKVPFDDHDDAAARAAAILRERRRTSAETLDYLRRRYSVADQLDAYADAILNATKAPPMRYRLDPMGPATRFAPAPWCDLRGNRVYHDYHGVHVEDAPLARLVGAFPGGFTRAEAVASGCDEAAVLRWYRGGYLRVLD